MDVHARRDASFGEIHFGNARLGDARRTRRLVKTADLIMGHPGGTLPQKLSHWPDLMGLYRLVSADEVTHRAVIRSPCERTLRLAAGHAGVVLFIRDLHEGGRRYVIRSGHDRRLAVRTTSRGRPHPPAPARLHARPVDPGGAGDRGAAPAAEGQAQAGA